MIRESVRILRVKAALLLDVPGVDEDLTIDGLELVGAWSEHLRDDIWSLPQRGELVVMLVALDKTEHQVIDVEGPTQHSTAMVFLLTSMISVFARTPSFLALTMERVRMH